MSEMKPTPGTWKWDSDPVKGDPMGRVRFRVVTRGKTITQCYQSSGDENAESDARLIAEAGSVFHETQLSPRQLVEMNAELVEALQLCLNAVCLAGWKDDLCAVKARAALTKASASSISKGVE